MSRRRCSPDDVIAYQENQLFIAVRPVRTREPGQSRKRLLRIIARLKARHPDPIRQMLVAARHMPLPTTKRSLTRMGRNAVEEKLELDLNARLKKLPLHVRKFLPVYGRGTVAGGNVIRQVR